MDRGVKQNRASVKENGIPIRDLGPTPSFTMQQIHTQVASIHPRDLKLCRSCGQLCFYLGHMSPHHAVDSKTGVNIDSMPMETRPSDKVKKCSVTLNMEKEMECVSAETVVHIGENQGKCCSRITTTTTTENGHKFKKNVLNAEERVSNVSKSSETASNASQVSVQKPKRIIRSRAPSQESVSPSRRQSRISAQSKESVKATRARSRTLPRSSGVKGAQSARLSASSQENVNNVKSRVQQKEIKGKTKDSVSAPSSETARTTSPTRESKSKLISQTHNSGGKTYIKTRKGHGAPLSVSEEDFQRHMRSMSKTTSSSSEESVHTINGGRNPSPRAPGQSHQSAVNHFAVAEEAYKKPTLGGNVRSTAKCLSKKGKIIVRNPNAARPIRSSANRDKSRTSCELYILEDGVSKMQRKSCDICQRWFDVNRVDAHRRICQRLADVEAEKQSKAKKIKKRSFVSAKKSDKGKPPSRGKAEGKNSDWRRKHEDFINTIRSAKLLSAHLAAGGKASDLPPPPPSDTSDYVQCPHCLRKFCEGAAERHIKFCETQHRSGSKMAMSRAMSVHRK